jgi:hypothetical protein
MTGARTASSTPSPGPRRDRDLPERAGEVPSHAAVLPDRGHRRAHLDAPSGATYFRADLPEDEQKVVWATAYPPAADLFARNAPRRHQPAGHWGAVRQAGGLYFL